MNKTKIALYSQQRLFSAKENEKERCHEHSDTLHLLAHHYFIPLFTMLSKRGFSLLVFLVDIDNLLGNAIPIIFAHIIVDMSQWSFDNLPELFGKFIHVATMEVIILW